MKLSSLSICIPAYKDEQTIERVVRRANQVGKMYAKRYEIVVINDASTDATGTVLRRLAKQFPMLRVIHHIKNQGYGGTLGHLYTTAKYNWLYTSPGDYQMDPMEISRLVIYTNKADMIIGWRKTRCDTWRRKMQSAIYNGLLRWLFSVSIHDVNSVRLMRRELVEKKLLYERSAFIDAKLTINAINKGFRVFEIPITHRTRETSGASGGKLSIIFPVIQDMFVYKMQQLKKIHL